MYTYFLEYFYMILILIYILCNQILSSIFYLNFIFVISCTRGISTQIRRVRVKFFFDIDINLYNTRCTTVYRDILRNPR